MRQGSPRKPIRHMNRTTSARQFNAALLLLLFTPQQHEQECIGWSVYVTRFEQGSYRSWKTWKVMKFKNFIFQACKVMEFENTRFQSSTRIGKSVGLKKILDTLVSRERFQKDGVSLSWFTGFVWTEEDCAVPRFLWTAPCNCKCLLVIRMIDNRSRFFIFLNDRHSDTLISRFSSIEVDILRTRLKDIELGVRKATTIL